MLGRKCFLDTFSFIRESTLSLLDTRPLFELPVEEDTAYMLIVRPRIKEIFTSPDEIIQSLIKFPYNSLVFAKVQQEMAKSFNSFCINVWQDSIIRRTRNIISTNYKTTMKEALLTKDKSQINPYIVRFLKGVNQMQVNYLF